MASAIPQTSVDASTGASSGHGILAPRSSMLAAGGVAWADEDTPDSLRAAQERGDGLDDLGPLDPRPVARALDDLHARLAAQALGVEVRELGREVLVLGTPDDQRGGADLAEASAGGLERLGSRGAVELEDRPLGAVVEALVRAVEQLVRNATPTQRELEAQPHRELAHERPAPEPGRPVPAVTRQERHRVHHHEPLDAVRDLLREREPDGAPVVHDQ